MNLINSTKKNNYFDNIKEQCLEIPKFNIIDLPERGLDFLNKANGNCFYCNKKNILSYLCLFCGKIIKIFYILNSINLKLF